MLNVIVVVTQRQNVYVGFYYEASLCTERHEHKTDVSTVAITNTNAQCHQRYATECTTSRYQ